MAKIKLPTIKAIMSEKKCSRNRAISIRARMEMETDLEHFAKFGKHLLEAIAPSELTKNPTLAVHG